jgi:hypothetical protein
VSGSVAKRRRWQAERSSPREIIRCSDLEEIVRDVPVGIDKRASRGVNEEAEVLLQTVGAEKVERRRRHVSHFSKTKPARSAVDVIDHDVHASAALTVGLVRANNFEGATFAAIQAQHVASIVDHMYIGARVKLGSLIKERITTGITDAAN